MTRKIPCTTPGRGGATLEEGNVKVRPEPTP